VYNFDPKAVRIYGKKVELITQNQPIISPMHRLVAVIEDGSSATAVDVTSLFSYSIFMIQHESKDLKTELYILSIVELEYCKKFN
jgi:hypothetical protein